MGSVHLYDKKFNTFIKEKEILERVNQLAQAISKDYRGKDLILIGIMNGAVIFLSDLCRKIELPLSIASMKASSYRGMKSSGIVQIESLLNLDLKDKHLLLVEDIVDTGKTLFELKDHLFKAKPASIGIATLLFKPQAFEYNYHLNYVGFEIPNKFVVGYGLDFDELGRNLPDIYQLDTTY